MADTALAVPLENLGEAGKTIPMAAPQKQPKNGRSRARLYLL